MTDEEKAEDRYCKTCKKKNDCFHNCDVFIEYTKGLAEGRKEAYELYDTEVNDIAKDYEERLKKLEIENAELESKLNDSNELCNKQAMRIAELEAQIEKMKNFYNCTKYHYCFCKTKNCKDCKDWKMND